MWKLIILVLAYGIFGCINNNSVKLPTHGSIRLMTRCDSIPTIFLYTNLASPFDFTDIRGLPDSNPFITDIEYIALDESIGHIGNVHNILFIEDRIIIHDNSSNSEAVLVFDRNGKGIKRLKAGGRGPSEFFGIAQLYTFPGADFFVVSDSRSSGTQYFDLNGEHIKTEHTLLHSFNRWPINDSILVYGSSWDQNYHIEELVEYSIYTGVKDSVLFKGIKFAQHQKSAWITSSFKTNYLGKLQIRQHANDSIYQIVNDSTYFVPYVVKFEKSLQHQMEKLPEGTDFTQFYMQNLKEKYYHKLTEFLENDNSIIYIICGGGLARSLFLYDKNKGKSYQFRSGIVQIPKKTLWAGQIPIAIYNNKYVAAIPGYIIYNMTKDSLTVTDNNTGEVIEKIPVEFDKSVADIVNNINESSNHVLMFFRFEFE